MSFGAVLIIGANSDIARATAHEFASNGHDIQLAGRDSHRLEADRKDMELRYSVQVTVHKLDVLEADGHAEFVKNLPELPRIVVCAVGYMPNQNESEADLEMASQVIRTNFEGPASLFSIFANEFEKRGFGCLVGISSVAGERGRATNYTYGAAKSGFTAFLSGLRNRLNSKGVHVVTVLPGFVATRMTDGMNLPARLTAQPEEVAQAIVNAVKKRKNVIYVRKIWRIIMLVIRSIPEIVFKKLKI